MNNISYKNKWNTGVVQVQMEPPPIPLIKINPNDNLDKDFVEIKFLRYPTSENSYLYEFKMNLFDNGDPEEFFFFVRNCNMTLTESITLEMATKVQYLHTLIRR